jgi:hypothetical protein
MALIFIPVVGGLISKRAANGEIKGGTTQPNLIA